VNEPVRLEPMNTAEFEAWTASSVTSFAAQQVASGLQPGTEATEYAERAFAEQLPGGLGTPLHHFWTVRSRDDVVGHLWLRVRPLSVEVEGYVYDVELRPAARGRGLGRATMLAAEDAARRLGATVMRLNVFGHNTTAISLYESLGYDVTSTTMTRRLDFADREGSPAGPRMVLQDMPREDYAGFRRRMESDYAANIAVAGLLPPAEASRHAAEDIGTVLPGTRPGTEQLLWTAYDGADPVAELWLHLQQRSDGLHAVGRRLEVREDVRCRGYGRAAAETGLLACRDRGVVTVSVLVFGFQAAARRLVDGLGFGLTAQTMSKNL